MDFDERCSHNSIYWRIIKHSLEENDEEEKERTTRRRKMHCKRLAVNHTDARPILAAVVAAVVQAALCAQMDKKRMKRRRI